jgi:hypothetical protein
LATNSDKNDLFNLYKKVQKKDKHAEDELICIHKKKYPNNYLNKIERGEDSNYRVNLHLMYLHLTR